MESLTPPQRTLIDRVLFSHDERRLRAGWRLILHFFLLIIFLVLFESLFSWLLTPILQGLPERTYFLIGQITSIFAITLSVWIARKFLDRRSFASLGLQLNAYAGKDLLVGFALPGLMMGLIFLGEWASGWLTLDGFSWEQQSWSQLFLETAAMFVVFIFVSWQEELVSRGYWLQNITDGSNLTWGMLISSSIFALGHLANPNVSLMGILGLVLGGLFFAYATTRTGQLWLAIGLHTGWNFFESTIFGFPVSGMSDVPKLILQTSTGSELITGGAFGPEAGLVLIPALALGTAFIYWYSRNRKNSLKGN